MRRLAGDVVPVEGDAPERGLVDARDHVEEGGLAGAIWPDQADDRALGDREVDIRDRDQSAELLTHLLGDEEIGHQ
jgi:hypothetical protein